MGRYCGGMGMHNYSKTWPGLPRSGLEGRNSGSEGRISGHIGAATLGCSKSAFPAPKLLVLTVPNVTFCENDSTTYITAFQGQALEGPNTWQ